MILTSAACHNTNVQLVFCFSTIQMLELSIELLGDQAF